MDNLDDKIAYCENCLSLSIIIDDDSKCDVCSKCGCTSIVEADIEEWEKLYKEKYPKGKVLHPRGIFDINKYKPNKYYS